MARTYKGAIVMQCVGTIAALSALAGLGKRPEWCAFEQGGTSSASPGAVGEVNDRAVILRV